jgi:Zn-dependent protease with chaperone function
MAAGALLLVVGLVTPLVLRGRMVVGSSPVLVIAGNLAALVLAWIGVFALTSTISTGVAVGDLAELCRLFVRPINSDGAITTTVATAAVVLLPGRALWCLVRSCGVQLRIRRSLRTAAPRRAVTHARLDTVACTVGVLAPRIVVDPERFCRLSPAHQRTVLAHERGHARGRHLLIDLVTRCLAAGLAPWPGARSAAAEVRRHLEAAADDAAAKEVGRREVAAAIVDVACQPPPRVGVLAAAGWAVWRVDRLLVRSTPHAWATSASVGVVALIALVAVHVVAHPFHTIAELPSEFWSALCCVV